MANVNRDRGQLILVTGLLVAVTMVALVLLLNTAIYTENLASRGADQSGREAVEFRSTVVEGVGELIDAENDREHESWDAVNDSTENGIDTIDDLTAKSYATGGTVVRIDRSAMTLHEGRLIRQTDQTREFVDASGTSTWTVADQIDGTRGFAIAANRADLNVTNESEAVTDSAFRVRLTGDGGNEWRAFVYENRSTGDIAVATKVDASSTNELCSVTANDAIIDFSSGMLAGEPCSGFEWAEGISSPYVIEYVNGANVTGTYNLTVNVTGSSTFPGLNDGTSNPSSPYHVPAVYSAAFDVSFETRTVTYLAEVRVAPGEPR